jgi:ornithine--oxo-acid transaminase
MKSAFIPPVPWVFPMQSFTGIDLHSEHLPFSLFSGARPMSFDLKNLVATRMGENYDLHTRHLNPMLVEVLRITGFDKVYVRAEGAYLYDGAGHEYLDFLSGYGVFNMGRNHPTIKKAIRDTLDLDLPNMVQLDCSLLSGLLAEALLKKLPAHLEAIFFCNSGTEAVEGAIKFARAATGRSKIVSLKGCYHGLSYGALSVTGSANFQEGFGPFLADVARIRLGDLDGLEKLLKKENVAAFLFEPVQGKGVNFPIDDFYQKSQALCQAHGALVICDEIQSGMGRTGKWWAFQHWNLEPDIVTVAKSLSGGFVPCGAIVTRRAIYQKVFSRLDRAVVHSSTFGRNNLAMACGLAALDVLENEKLIENSAMKGQKLLEKLDALRAKHSLIKDVRGKGLMIAIEFHEPAQLALKLAWRIMHRIDHGLFAQLVIVPLLSQHRILTQVAGHNMDVIKILPPLIITEKEVNYFVNAFDEALQGCRRFPGPILELARNTAFRRMKRKIPPNGSGYEAEARVSGRVQPPDSRHSE